MTTPRSPHPGADLRLVMEAALEAGGALLTAGERVVVARIERLPEEPLELYARMWRRRGPVFRRSELDYALDVDGALRRLAEDDLVMGLATEAERLGAFPVEILKAACRELGLPTVGRRADLEQRLTGRIWRHEALFRLSNVGLLRRLEALCFNDPWLDVDVLVAERLGHIRWPTYTPTGGAGGLPHRRALRVWERALTSAWDSADEAIVALDVLPEGDRARDRAARFVMENTASAEALSALHTRGYPVTAAYARLLESTGRNTEALRVCEEGRGHTPDRPAIDRVARRLARRLGTSWPSLALLDPTVRYLQIEVGEKKVRQMWRVGATERHVEAACGALLTTVERRWIHAENWLWVSLFALVFRDLYWLPVPGMLPHARMSGPRDLGRPAFYLNRREVCDARLAALEAEGPARFIATWGGEWIGGLSRVDDVVRHVQDIPYWMCRVVLERLCREGWAAARGLPDLLVLPGPEARLPGSVPARVPDFAFLCEVKAPGDDLGDAQRVWHDYLLRNKIHVELWMVRGHSL